MNLTPNFTLEELTASETAERNGWDNSPNDQELANLTKIGRASCRERVCLYV